MQRLAGSWSARGRRGSDPGDQLIEFDLEPAQDLVVRKCSEKLSAAFEIHVRRCAPQAEIGVVRFTWTVLATSHDGDRLMVIGGVTGQLAHLFSQFDES